MRLVLYQPEIPSNVGALLRLSACWNVPMDCIGPFPFIWSDRSLKRAGLDYIPHAEYHLYTSWENYQQKAAPVGRHVLLTTHTAHSFLDFSFEKTDCLMIGSESCGVPVHVAEYAQAHIKIPMRSVCRSLNMSMAAAVVLARALEQLGDFPPVV